MNLSSPLTYYECFEYSTSDIWTFEPVPFLLKIHQNLLNRLMRNNLFSTPKASYQPNSYFTTKSAHFPGEDLELVVEFFPGVGFSRKDWLDFLATWAQQIDVSRTFQQHIDSIKFTFGESIDNRDGKMNAMSRWERMRNGFAHSIDDSFEHCEIPSSVDIEFLYDESGEGFLSVSKFIDLSGWKLEDSASRHSGYCFVKLIEVISSLSAVLSISAQSRPTLLNYDVRGLVQSGVATHAPLTDAGLLGEGQVVGVADSGLDDKSCFLWDNSNSYNSPYTTRNSGGGTLEPLRRKVVQYTSYADGYDNAAGHGTHVVGTIVGNSINADFSRANGVAPAAKVAFYDVQKDGQAYLNMPGLRSSLFPTLYNAGARVFSNSWGAAGSDYYSDKCYDVDTYTYSNPDVLIIFAAGNTGATGSGSGSLY